MKKIMMLLAAMLMMASFNASAYTWPARTAMVHLFEWKWSDVALECEKHLGPGGYAAVQVSPAQENRVITNNPFGSDYPWYQRYQPVGMTVNTSRSGTRAQFSDMVSRCAAVGVDVYVDVIINHTTGDPAQTGGTCVGSAGTTCGLKSVSGLFSNQDYHNDCSINWNDRWSVTNCWLSGLADLNTASTYVQSKIKGYMEDLRSLGVKGIRVDAAKHIDANELSGMITGLSNGNFNYIFMEVIADATTPFSYYTWIDNGQADVTEFKWGHEIKNAFQNGGQIGWLDDNGGIGSTNWGFVASSSAAIFVENHDEERNSGGLTYKDGANYSLAMVFTLAHGYGYPKVMSSFTFTDSSKGPPGSGGVTSSVWTNSTTDVCGQGGWVCQHRWPAAKGMVGFRNATTGQGTAYAQHSNNHISIIRGNKGFATINRETTAKSINTATGLSDGVYCDVANATFNFDTNVCTGATYTVSGGNLNTSVPSNGAIALHSLAKVPSATANINFICANGTTYSGQSVYVVGNNADLGNWAITNAAKQKLDPVSYPTWNKIITVAPNTAIQWKCVKALESNTGTIQQWEGGSNNSITSGAVGSTKNSTGGAF